MPLTWMFLICKDRRCERLGTTTANMMASFSPEKQSQEALDLAEEMGHFCSEVNARPCSALDLNKRMFKPNSALSG